MQLLTNKIEPNAVTRQMDNGTEWLTAPVVMAQAMHLNGGYLPQSEIEASAEAWNGIDVPIAHPTKNGEAVSVDADHDTPVIGEIRNAKAEGEKLLGELWLNIQSAKQAGTEGVQVLSRLAGGEPLEVSTAYFPNTVEKNAEADGKVRNKVVRDIEPDHLAVLPNEKGKCSVSDGCGAPVANQLLVPMANDGQPEDMGSTDSMQANQLSEARTPAFDGTTTGEWSKPDFSEYVAAFGYDAEEVGELSADQRQRIAETTLLGDPEADTFENVQFFPVVEPESMNLSENALMAVLSGRGAQADIPQDTLESSRSVARRLLEEEFDRDMSENSAFQQFLQSAKELVGRGEQAGNEGAESSADTVANDMTHDTDAHDYLVNEHGYDRENLPPAGSDCIEKMEQNHRELAEMDTESEAPEDEPEANADTEDIEATVEAKVEEILSANEQSELVDEIMANTDQYDRETLEQTPEGVLESIHDDVTSTPAANMPANTGRKAVSNSDEEYSGPTDFGEYTEGDA